MLSIGVLRAYCTIPQYKPLKHWMIIYLTFIVLLVTRMCTGKFDNACITMNCLQATFMLFAQKMKEKIVIIYAFMYNSSAQLNTLVLFSSYTYIITWYVKLSNQQQLALSLRLLDACFDQLYNTTSFVWAEGLCEYFW